MTTKALAAAMLLSLVGAVAHAQRAVPETPVVDVEADDDEATGPDTRPHIQVLQHPYDIASFYRSSDGLVFGQYGGVNERYPIAGFYRQNGGGNYAQFWTNGYSDRAWGRGGNVHPRGRHGAGMGLGFRRQIGENGDLFLFAPAFLGPVGPLTGVFFGDSLP